MTLTAREIVAALKRYGFSYREIARHLGVSHVAVFYWVKGIYKPKNPEKVLHCLRGLLADLEDRLVNDYYSDNHNDVARDLILLREGLRTWKLKRLVPRLLHWADVIGISDNKPIMEVARDLLAKRRTMVDDDSAVLGALLASIHIHRPEMTKAVIDKLSDLPFLDTVQKAFKTYFSIACDLLFPQREVIDT